MSSSRSPNRVAPGWSSRFGPITTRRGPYRCFADALARSHVLLRVPTELELRSIITVPAAEADVIIEDQPERFEKTDELPDSGLLAAGVGCGPAIVMG